MRFDSRGCLGLRRPRFEKNGKPTILTLGPTGPAASPLNFRVRARLSDARTDLEFPLALSLPLAIGTGSSTMQFEHTTLDNGLEVIAELNDRALSVAAGFVVKAGSRDESAEVAGVSHFLEHMTFKGTKRRDAVAVNRDFDRVGAKHNAQTSEEDTFYHVTCLPEYLPQAFDVLADILRPTLRVDDFETEKKVIIEEIRMYLDNPMSVAYEAAKTAHFGSHPLGNSILGTVESITAMEAEQMRDVLRATVQPLEHRARIRRQGRLERARRAGERHCGRWEGGVAAPRSQAVSRFRVIQRDPSRRRPATDRRGRLQRASARKPGPVCGAPAGDHPGRPHRLAAVLDA